MNITAITLFATLAGTGARAVENAGAAPARSVTVCMEEGSVSLRALQARSLASGMFAAIGVKVAWRNGLRGCPPQGIMISLNDVTPDSLKPGALAAALPYEGTHIRVFYDRILRYDNRRGSPAVLGHVLVHEITHVLQGIDRHSDAGIMKARWDRRDFDLMAARPLEFTPEDIDLIYRGLAARARGLVAMNAAPAAVLPSR